MSTINRNPTLQLTWPLGQVPLLALLMLGLIIGLAEGMARTETVQAQLPPPTLGSGHTMFDTKVALLEAFVEKEGPVDCIFLGASVTNAGIDPEIFEQVYQNRTGQELKCFNFGIKGLMMYGTAAVAQMLVETYQPRLLILSTLPGLEQEPRQAEQLVLDSPWLQYKLGQPRFDGWLLEHSVAYRYWLHGRIWLEQPPSSSAGSPNFNMVYHPNGYSHFQKNRKMVNINHPPDPIEEAELFEYYADFEISEGHLAALERILQLQSEQMTVVIAEVPVHPTFFRFFPRGQADYERILAVTRQYADHYEVLFLTTPKLNLIPNRGWRNRNHLNQKGAKIFSRWLGQEIGQAVNQGRLPDPGKTVSSK